MAEAWVCLVLQPGHLAQGCVCGHHAQGCVCGQVHEPAHVPAAVAACGPCCGCDPCVEKERRKSRRAKNYGWDADEPEENLAESDSNHLIGGGVIANASASSANSNALTTQQQEKLEQVRQRKVMIFGSVEQATEAVKDAGDSLSAILHSLVVNLDTLDDAMDDWDGSPEDEMGDEYADLEDEIDDGFNNRRVSRRGNL
mgnify:CR=1 FL=1